MAGKTSVILCLCLCATVSLAQNFGYPNQREYRRYPSQQFEYNQNNPRRLTAIIHLQPYNRPESYEYVYPFNNRQGFHYDRYGRPVVDPSQNRPYEENWQNQPNQNWGGSQGRNPRYPGESNAEYVRFPESNSPGVIFTPVNIENDEESKGLSLTDGDKSGRTNDEFTEPNERPELTPVPTEPSQSSQFTEPSPQPTEPSPQPTEPSPQPTESKSAFTSASEATLPILTPVPADIPYNDPVFTTPVSTLPLLTPVPASESRNNFNFEPAKRFNDPCEVDSVQGSCLPLLQCDTFAKLLVQAKSDPKVVTLLRKAHCGFDGSNPKVCCPLPGIPDKPPPQPTSSPSPIPSVAPSAESKSADGEDSAYIDALPEPPVCGNSTATLTRVVGGIDAKLGDFPWMALLGYKKRGNVAWSCGGSLISEKHVLTAAHCIHNLEKSLYVVRLGELDLGKEDEGATPVDVLIKKMIKHEAYNRSSLTNDIGMLLLERSVQFTDLIRPICIPTSQKLRSKNFENYNPLVAGWGSVAWEGPSASILQVLQLPVVGNTYCQEKFKAYKQISIDERVLCAGYKKGGKDACQGDSGGPLMQPIWNEDFTTYFYQIGVVSFGKKCAEPGYPGVYTRVTTFVPWITEKMLGPR